MKNGIRKLESREDFKKVYQVFTEEPYNPPPREAYVPYSPYP